MANGLVGTSLTNDQRRRVSCSAMVSFFFHVCVLSIAVVPPVAVHMRYRSLEAVLVNQASAHKPKFAQVQAQANLLGGGDLHEKAHASTYLPVLAFDQSGHSVHDRHARFRLNQSRRVLTAEKIAEVDVRNSAVQAVRSYAPSHLGEDIQEEKAIVASIRGQIEHLIEARNRALLRLSVGLTAQKVSHAYYTNEIADRIERYGSKHFPEEARGKSFKVMVTLSIHQDGTLEKVTIERSSGSKSLDRTAEQIIRQIFPFRPFPPSISSSYVAIDMTRTIRFWSVDVEAKNAVL